MMTAYRHVGKVSMLAAVATALLVCTGAVGAAGQAAVGDKVLALWLWGSTVRSQGADKVAQDLAKHGVTDVFLLVRGTAGKADYQSSLAPPAEEGKEALGDLLKACRPLGIKVHAWFVFNQDKAYTDEHPEDRLWHHGNASTEFKPYEITDGRVCPASEAHLEYTKAMIKEVLEGYDVDGIHLDYIRYGHMVYCFCERHMKKAAELGIDVDRVRQVLFDTNYASPAQPDLYFEKFIEGDPDVAAWVNMRREEVQTAAAAFREAAESVKPGVAFSAALMPEGALEETYAFAMCHYSQSYEDAGKLYDFVCPMAYHLDYDKAPDWVGQVTAGTIEAVGSGVPVYAGIQAYGDKADYDQVKQAVEAALEGGAKGIALFRYGDRKSVV